MQTRILPQFFCRIFSSTHLLHLFLLTFTYFSSTRGANDCAYYDDCRCILKNGSVIDISSIGLKSNPRWLNVATSTSDTSSYSFNGCKKFSMASCQNVFVCKRTSSGVSEDCGDTAMFLGDGKQGSINLTYVNTFGRTTFVELICSPNAHDPLLQVIGELSPSTYRMTLTSRCGCADLCLTHHLSTGSVLVILFLIAVSFYLVLGIIHSSLTRGAHGWELIPHYEFWVDFPLLVKDGCVFFVSGCKAETAYERI